MTLGEVGSAHILIKAEIGNPPLFSVYRGDGTKLSSGTIVFPTDVWSYMEIRYSISDTVGSYELRINGTASTSGSGVDTRNGGSGVMNSIAFYHNDISGDFASTIDDLYVTNDTVFFGDTRVEYLAPTGPGIKTQLAPSAGSNWQTVDESVPSDTDYNSSSTPGAMDLFGMRNLAGNGLIYGVQSILRCKKDDAGFRSVKPAFFKAGGIGSTDRYYTGNKSFVGDGFFSVPAQIYDTSPDTGTAWTVDEVNALQYGYAVGDAGMFTLDAKLV
jgi:hypothetical protein